MKVKFFPSLFILTCLWLVACTANEKANLIAGKNNCVSPELDFAIPLASGIAVSPPTEVHPPQNWQLQSVAPDNINLKNAVYLNNSIWALASESQNDNSTRVFEYHIDTNMWEEHANASSNLVNLKVFYNKGALWGISQNPEIGLSITRYNPETDKFESLTGEEGFFKVNENWVDFAEDLNGDLWFINQKGLWQYVLNDKKLFLRTQIQEGERFDNIVIDPEGNLWFLETTNNEILKFNPHNDDLVKFSGYPSIQDRNSREPFSEVVNTFFDNKGRFWLDDRGYLDTKGSEQVDGPIWYQAFRSPLFISRSSSWPTYEWNRPKIILESSNGLLWFLGANSLVSLNPEVGEWCKIATKLDSNMFIAEDDNKYLWLLYGKSLYRKPLND